MRENVFVTNSGVFDQPVFKCAVSMIGIDNLMFSVDDPFQDNFEAIDFLNAAELSQEEKEKFAHSNAERLLKLSSAPHEAPGHRLSSSWYTFRAKSKSKIGRALISFLVK